VTVSTGSLPTTVTAPTRARSGSTQLAGRSFKAALGEFPVPRAVSRRGRQHLAEQEAAGLDIVTTATALRSHVGGNRVFYPSNGWRHRRPSRTSRGWMSRHGLRPGKILWEVQEAYQPAWCARSSRAPPGYTELWKVAQRLTDRPLNSAPSAPALSLDVVERVL